MHQYDTVLEKTLRTKTPATITDGHNREKPSDAFSADVATTSLAIASARNTHCCIPVILTWRRAALFSCQILPASSLQSTRAPDF